MERIEQLKEDILKSGATAAAVISAEMIETDSAFREMCRTNACGKYGKCWTCPPYVGEIEQLVASIGEYRYALVYQSIGTLEDSFDFEGMMAAKRVHFSLSQKVGDLLSVIPFQKVLHLGAGGCGVCEKCAVEDQLPCRAPDKALASLESYGINVSRLVKAAGMNYINGKDTVTYFGAVLFTI